MSASQNPSHPMGSEDVFRRLATTQIELEDKLMRIFVDREIKRIELAEVEGRNHDTTENVSGRTDV
jgi:hypothetical protein